MGLFSVLASAAPLAGYAFGGPVGGMVAGGLGGALAANERNNELSARERKSLNARADAIEASWARRDGRGSIPEAFYNEESASGNMGAGALAGIMQGYGAKNLFEGGLFGKAGGLGPQEIPGTSSLDRFSKGGLFGGAAAPSAAAITGGASLGAPDLGAAYGLPEEKEVNTLFGKLKRY